MARTITPAAATEYAKVTGGHPIYILEVAWGGSTGVVYYASEALSSPVTAQGRVVNWGELQIRGEPERVGGFNQLTIELSDADLVLKALFDADLGPQNKIAKIWQFWVGTTWATDRIQLFGS